MNSINLPQGSKITVLDSQKVELGDGTLIQLQLHPDMNLTVYECEEHLILAKGQHWVRYLGQLIKIRAPE